MLDLQAALDWYEHVLGFELESRLAIDAIPASSHLSGTTAFASKSSRS
ncbi:VOC family protein [Paraburkholderia fungorum]